MKKKCQNPKCGKDFETDSKKKVFCSTKCRVAYGRTLAKGDVTTADQIPVPPAKKHEFVRGNLEWEDDTKKKVVFKESPDGKQLLWVKFIEDYCNKNGCMPSDLVEAHQNKNKAPIGKGKGEVTFQHRNPRTGKMMQIIDGEKVQEAPPANETYMQKRLRLKNSGTK